MAESSNVKRLARTRNAWHTVAMTGRSEHPHTTSRGALIWFFALAFGIAWGALGLFQLLATGVPTVDGLQLLARADDFDLNGLALPIPGWLVYLLGRVADFSFSIAGVVVIAVTRGGAGLRELWGRLLRFRIPGWCYAVALLPLLFTQLPPWLPVSRAATPPRACPYCCLRSW